MLFNPSSWISISAKRYPQHPCIKYKDFSATYFEVNQRSNRLAWGLMERGILKGMKVATLQFNSNQIIEETLAMWKAGIILVPLNTRNSARHNIEFLKDCDAKALIFGVEFVDQIESMRRELPNLKHFICIDDSEKRFIDYESLLSDNTREPNMDIDENEVYRIAYTSGTTATPRGVLQTYRNRKEQIANTFMNTHIYKDDIFLHVCPLTHAAGYLFLPFYLAGAKQIILDKWDPEVFMETIEKERVTCALLVPTMIYMLLELKNLKEYDYSSLRQFFYGTAPISYSKLKAAIEVFGSILRQNFGLTEAVQTNFYLGPEEHVVTGDEDIDKRLKSAGRRGIGPEIQIVNENDEVLPPGEVGEIVIRSPHTSTGYLNLPELTAEVYRNGWLHTGDLAYEDEEGYIFIVDRTKDMIISGGFNIYSREVEVYLDMHPAVLESAVIGGPHEKWGECVKAYIVLREGFDAPALEELCDFCVSRGLSGYKIPRDIGFLESLPKNENRKTMKRELRKLVGLSERYVTR